MSAEALCFARTKAEKLRVWLMLRLLGGPEVIVVLVQRNQEDGKTSWEHQLTKPGVSEVRLSDQSDVGGNWYYDLPAIESSRRVSTSCP